RSVLTRGIEALNEDGQRRVVRPERFDRVNNLPLNQDPHLGERFASVVLGGLQLPSEMAAPVRRLREDRAAEEWPRLLSRGAEFEPECDLCDVKLRAMRLLPVRPRLEAR